MSVVLREDAEGIATLTLNRPEQLNALNAELFTTLKGHLEAIAAAPGRVGCVILRANGRAFSAGADLKQPPSARGQAANQTIDFMEAMPQPVIASVHGYCFTGAIELILGADLLVAAESATFADTHAKWGLSAGGWGQSQRLPRRVGLMNAKMMMMTTRRYSAAEAHALGLVSLVVPDAELAEQTRTMARDIVANSWHSIRAAKMMLNASQEHLLRAGLEWALANNPGAAPDRDERIRSGPFKARS